MKRIRGRIVYLLVAVSLLFLLAFVPAEEEAGIYGSTVRLHILANSDTAEDQQLKIEVRDLIFDTYGDDLTCLRDADEASATLTTLLSEIENTARTYVEQKGYDYPVSAELTVEYFNTREYGTYTLPAGYYRSLQISIGEGVGQNWWCVLFPPLCYSAAMGEPTEVDPDSVPVGLTAEEYRLITGGKKGGYAVRFKVLEMLSDLFGN